MKGIRHATNRPAAERGTRLVTWSPHATVVRCVTSFAPNATVYAVQPTLVGRQNNNGTYKIP